MATPAPRRCTLGDYWAVEMASPVRNEFLHGTIYAMAGGSARHNEVASNAHLALGVALKGTGCHPLGADQRIRVSDEQYTYADVAVFCGRIEIAAGKPPDTATNPAVLVEVLSTSTREYECTEKLAMYQSLSTAREILLVEPERVWVAHWVRGPEGWTEQVVTDLTRTLRVLGKDLALADLYARTVT